MNEMRSFKKIFIILGAICLILMGLRNLYYTKSVKSKHQMVRHTGQISGYKCKGLEKYGDKLSLKMKDITNEIFLLKLELCVTKLRNC
jgi:hypothetical protein